MRECIRALNDYLPGYDQLEYQAIVKMFDPGDTDRLDISEVKTIWRHQTPTMRTV
jgi:hypothetical protein